MSKIPTAEKPALQSMKDTHLRNLRFLDSPGISWWKWGRGHWEGLQTEGSLRDPPPPAVLPHCLEE